METYVMIKAGLLLHLTGIILMIGITVASVATLWQSQRFFYKDADKALLMLRGTARYPLLQLTGALLLLTGGVIMMIAYHGVLMHVLWFKIKLGILALLILTQVIIGRPAMKHMRNIVTAHQHGGVIDTPSLIKAGMKWRTFTLLQLLLFLCIIVLSAFRFG